MTGYGIMKAQAHIRDKQELGGRKLRKENCAE
jgi:hypothetical protein